MEEYLKSLFINIIEDNKQRILRICRVYAPDKEDQKDLYQDVILNIWKSLTISQGWLIKLLFLKQNRNRINQ